MNEIIIRLKRIPRLSASAWNNQLINNNGGNTKNQVKDEIKSAGAWWYSRQLKFLLTFFERIKGVPYANYNNILQQFYAANSMLLRSSS